MKLGSHEITMRKSFGLSKNFYRCDICGMFLWFDERNENFWITKFDGHIDWRFHPYVKPEDIDCKEWIIREIIE